MKQLKDYIWAWISLFLAIVFPYGLIIVIIVQSELYNHIYANNYLVGFGHLREIGYLLLITFFVVLMILNIIMTIEKDFKLTKLTEGCLSVIFIILCIINVIFN